MDTSKYFLAVLVAFFVGCSSDSRVAGNSAETGSPELAGILVLDNGKPAARTKVQCVPGNYNIIAASEAEQVLPSAFETETDENGNYEFDTIPSGSFSLEAFHQESGQMLLLQNLNAEEDEPLAVNDTLRNSGTVKLLVPGAFRENQGGEAIVIGTTIRRRVSVQNGKIVVDSLPADTFELIVYMDGMSPFGFKDVSVKPEETTVWGDSVTYTFKAPLALPEEIDSLGTVVSDFPLAIRLTGMEIAFDSAEVVNGRWEAVRISKNGNRSKKLPISYPDFDKRAKEAVLWVNVDSLNVGDSLELSYDGLQYSAYARDVFPTNRSYSLVWHFGNALSPVTDASEYGYFDGSALSSVYSDAFVDGAVGGGIKFDSAYYFYVDNSAKPDSARKVNLNFDGSGYFCFSVWVKLDAVDKEQTIFEKAKEYALRFDPAKGFVVELWVPGADSDSVKYAWASGKSSVKAGEWTYIAFSHHTNSQTNFYVNDLKVESDPEETAWTDARNLTDFKVGGFAGVIDELMLGGCFRDDSWTRLTYLNQRPDNYWPVVTPR